MPGLIGNIRLTQHYEHFLTLNHSPIATNSSSLLSNGNYNLRLAKNSRNSAFYEHDKILVFCEGVFLNHGNTIEDTVAYLHKKYVSDGEKFAMSLRGSFQISIIDYRGPDNKYLLYSDPISSRPIFYMVANSHLYFSPDIDQLIEHTDTRSMDVMAIVNFMISGHFPTGHTGISEIKVLGPGEYIVIQAGSFQKKQYSYFDIEPDDQIDTREASETLDAVLTERILDHWKHAEDPAILLSGGYDSQYIFHTIAKSVNDTSRLITVTWGQEPRKRFADMSIARRTAKRFSTIHIEIEKQVDNWRQEYDDMFIAQNGMTDSSFYHAHELSVCRFLREEHNIKSVIRGDECFGFGPDAYDAQNALLPNSMSFPEYVPNIAEWFQSEKSIIEQYSLFLHELIERFHNGSYDCLKDKLDFYVRQHMNRNPLNYYKLHYIEVFCPLIDPDVLEIVSKLPSKFRRHKQLFKKITRKKIGRQLEIAERTNLTDWQKIIRERSEIKNFLIKELSKLPSFFDSVYFQRLPGTIQSQVQSRSKTNLKDFVYELKRVFPFNIAIDALFNKRHSKNKQLNIPAYILLMRAAVIARWNDWWIT